MEESPATWHFSLGAFHSLELLSCLDRQRTEHHNLCDVCFIVGTDRKYAHSCILVSTSAYFQGLLSGSFSESRGNSSTSERMMEVDLTDRVSCITYVETLLSAIYTGDLILSMETVAGVTELACFLLVEIVRSQCEKFLHDTLSLDTCIQYMKIAFNYDFSNLFNSCLKLLQCRFHDHYVFQSEMLTISPACLTSLPMFRFMRLQEILQFLIHWVENKMEVEWTAGTNEELIVARIKSACQVLNSHCQYGNYFDDVTPSDLVGNTDIINQLLETCTQLQRLYPDQFPSSKSVAVENLNSEAETAEEDEVNREQSCTRQLTSDQSSGNNSDQSPSTSAACSTDSCLVNCKKDATFKRKRSLSESRCVPNSVKHLKTEMNSNTSTSVCEVLVAFVPGKEFVNYFTATDRERNRPGFFPLKLEVCVYNIQRREWLWAGKSVFPGKFEDRDGWRTACVNFKAYFVSLYRRTIHVLDLRTMQWRKVACERLLQNMSGDSRVRSLVPIAVGDRLYVLASDRKLEDSYGMFTTQQQYFQLQEDDTWLLVADVEHRHWSTPLSQVSVSDGKVFVVKAAIAMKVEKSNLVIQEGHIFDCDNKTLTKFAADAVATSPLRILVRDGGIHLFDGEGIHLQLRPDCQAWDKKPCNVNLSDVKKMRAMSGDTFLPCVSHAAASRASCVWEFSSFGHRSTLTEVRLDTDDRIHSMKNMPPPFRYVTQMTACDLGSELVNSLAACQYLHSDTIL